MSCSTEDNLFPQRYEIDYVRVYQFSECLYGDTTLDGQLNVSDIVQLVNYILYPENNNVTDCSDINQDGSVNITDIVLLVELILNP